MVVAGDWFPELHDPVVTRRGKVAAVGAEGHGCNRRRMATEDCPGLPVAASQSRTVLIFAGCGDPPAVGAVSRSQDAALVAGGAVEVEDHPAFDRIPHLHGPLPVGRDKSPAVGAEGDG